MNEQQLQQLMHIPLKDCFICLESDCGHVHNSNAWCPACSSSTIMPLTKWVAEMREKVTA